MGFSKVGFIPMHPMLNIAVRAARSSGDQLIRSADNIGKLQINYKDNQDIAAEIELRAEQEITRSIHQAYPDHAVVTKQSKSIPENTHVWLLDTVNGLINFTRGFPCYAITMALQVNSKIEVAVIYDPLKDELFTANRGGGAMLNNRRIRVSRETALDRAILAIECQNTAISQQPNVNSIFQQLSSHALGIRQSGCAALDFAYLACGRLDGLCFFGLHTNTIAAGALIAREAGSIITDHAGKDQFQQNGNLIAGPARLQQTLFNSLEPLLQSE